MNYASIYADFINNRRQIESGLTGYVEKHHIKPRCLGGGDAPVNIIALTAEDHFFAHLLLAKTYGGRLWAPVAFMVGGSRKDYKPTVSRKRYGWVRRAMARAASGKGAHQYDWTIYHLVHKDGREWRGRQNDLHLIGVSKSLGNMLIKGRVMHAKGWRVCGRDVHENAGKNHHMYRADVHEFEHVDGRSFTGTQYEFHCATGLSKPSACKLARGTAIVWNGWHLKGAKLPTHGRASRWGKSLRERLEISGGLKTT